MRAGRTYTSAGTVAGVDLCLHLIRDRHGTQVTNDVARHLVVGALRDGGQAQYIQTPVSPRAVNDPVGDTLATMMQQLDQPLSVGDLARSAHLSTRHYLRRFRAMTGTTPYRWLVGQRVNRARELLETTPASVEHIAAQCGFRDATLLRDHFGRIVGVSPTRYRAQFGTTRTDTR